MGESRFGPPENPIFGPLSTEASSLRLNMSLIDVRTIECESKRTSRSIRSTRVTSSHYGVDQHLTECPSTAAKRTLGQDS